MVAHLPKDHPPAANELVSAEDPAREPLIFFPARDMPGFVAEIRPIFHGMPFPRVRTRVVHQETALGFVAAGVAFTLLPEAVTSCVPSSVRVARIDSCSTTVMYVAEPRTLTPAARLFRRALFGATAAVSASSSASSA
ncbi:LysR substrate-binding domain-containing protein [Streptomyces phaeolivaceus]|uniref:LysR substrate-binding domain-containing protein n=1 Tax=Streptomyces phaeolivaceus TaxID=2653200 RepID=UPI0021F8049C|nr:LysR substrate-binding domain-containing protein [Streptomyces phaeolivaceus]